jgi:hypothetical protein
MSWKGLVGLWLLATGGARLATVLFWLFLAQRTGERLVHWFVVSGLLVLVSNQCIEARCLVRLFVCLPQKPRVWSDEAVGVIFYWALGMICVGSALSGLRWWQVGLLLLISLFLFWQRFVWLSIDGDEETCLSGFKWRGMAVKLVRYDSSLRRWRLA